MKKTFRQITLVVMGLALLTGSTTLWAQVSLKHQDKPFIQDFSIKYTLADKSVRLQNVVADRNGYIQILSSKGLLRPRDGQFLFPGTIVTDRQDRPTSDKKIAGIGTYENQLVYIDDKAVLSNAWGGKLFSRHSLPGANIFAGGKDFTFLISDGKTLQLLKNSQKLWEGALPGEAVKEIKYDSNTNLFWILGKSSVSTFSPDKNELFKVLVVQLIQCAFKLCFAFA